MKRGRERKRNESGTVAGRTSAFSSTYLPLTSQINANRGSSLTFTRATTATVTDFEGLVKTVKSGEARFQGGRRVENLCAITSSEAFSGWTKTGSATTPTANTLSLTATGDWISSLASTGNTANRTVRATFKLSGSGYVHIQIGNNIDQAISTLVNLSTIPTRYTVSVQCNSTASGSFGYLVGRINSSATATSVVIENVLIEETTGQANQNPSEYVSNGVLSTPWHGANVDGVKYFDTYNGNTVASNVVTEATGAPLSTSPALLTEPARTNLCLQSNAFTTTWTAIGTPAATQNEIGLTGAANEAWTLTDNDAGVAEGISQPVTLTAAAYTYSIFIKKTSGATVFPVMEAITGTVTANCTVNTNTGVATVWTAYTGRTMLAGASATCVSHNSLFWRVSLTYTATVAAYTHSLFIAATATGNQSTGTIDATQQGSNVFTCAQIELGASASSYIPTTTIAVARNVDLATIPTAGNITAAAGSVYMEWAKLATGTHYLIRSSVDGSNYTQIYASDTAIFFNRFVAGVSKLTTYNISTVLGTTYKVAVSWATLGGLMSINGVAATPNVDTTSAQFASTFMVWQQAGDIETIKNLRTFTRQLSQAELNALTR